VEQVELAVGVQRIVMEEQDLLGLAAPREQQRVGHA
jgi:hypothetical protein